MTKSLVILAPRPQAAAPQTPQTLKQQQQQLLQLQQQLCGSSSTEIKLVWSYDVTGVMVIFVQAAKTVQIHELQTQSTKRCFSYL